MHLWKRKQAWDTTLLGQGNGWSSITAGTSSKGMGMPKYGMHTYQKASYACMCVQTKATRAMHHVAKRGQDHPPIFNAKSAFSFPLPSNN